MEGGGEKEGRKDHKCVRVQSTNEWNARPAAEKNERRKEGNEAMNGHGDDTVRKPSRRQRRPCLLTYTWHDRWLTMASVSLPPAAGGTSRQRARTYMLGAPSSSWNLRGQGCPPVSWRAGRSRKAVSRRKLAKAGWGKLGFARWCDPMGGAVGRQERGRKLEACRDELAPGLTELLKPPMSEAPPASSWGAQGLR